MLFVLWVPFPGDDQLRDDLALSERAPVDHIMVWLSCLPVPAAYHSGCGQCGCDLITDWTFLGSIYTRLHSDSLCIT